VLLADHYDQLKDITYVASPAPSVLQLALNKASTLTVARLCGLRVPNSVLVNSFEELDDALLKVPLPAVVKPAFKDLREEVFKSCVIRSREEMHARFPQSQSLDPPLLVQEFCEGVGVGIEVLMYKGEPRAVFQHRRLKEYPFKGGFSVVACAEIPHAQLVEASVSLLRAMGWDGVAMVEYRVNPPSGYPTLLEVNGRYWGSIGLPVAAGVDFPLYHWQLVHDEVPNPPREYRAGTKWRWTAGYIARLHELLALAAKTAGGRHALMSALRDLPRDFSPTVFDASFRWSDPAPGFGEFVLATEHFMVYDAKAIMRRLSKKHSRQPYSLSRADS
jgi:predicted ATP-grasp superfamily ATP-dependent carboligase